MSVVPKYTPPETVKVEVIQTIRMIDHIFQVVVTSDLEVMGVRGWSDRLSQYIEISDPLETSLVDRQDFCEKAIEKAGEIYSVKRQEWVENWGDQEYERMCEQRREG